MRQFVYGDDVILKAFRVDGYYPFACVEKVQVRVYSELMNVTTQGDGAWEYFKPSGRNRWDASLSGVTVLRDLVDTLWYGWETFLKQIRTQGLNVLFEITDPGGFVKSFYGFVYIPESEINGTSGDFSRFSVNLQGSGPIDPNGIIQPITEPDVERLEWIATGAEPNIVQHNKLIGITKDQVQMVSFEGDDKYFVIVAGEPNGKQVRLDNAAGTLRFAVDFENGDQIWCQILNS
jgi:hypothetical protein